MAGTKTHPIKSTLKAAIDYILNPEKTDGKKVFGDHAYKMTISSNKSMTGHLLGAAGGVEAIATVMTIANGIIPPTINYEDPDLEEGLDLSLIHSSLSVM